MRLVGSDSTETPPRHQPAPGGGSRYRADHDHPVSFAPRAPGPAAADIGRFPGLERALGECLASFEAPPVRVELSVVDMAGLDVERTVRDIFAILTHRRFSHLSRSRAEPYREEVSAHLRSDIDRGRPVAFYYDIGPGYHASIDMEGLELSFEPALGEMIALHQIVKFSREVQRVYPPGARFWLVIDDLCGRATNDIPLERTSAYVARLRCMIEELCLDSVVSVLAESELNTWETYVERLTCEPRGPIPDVKPEDVSNVTRFLGRPCDSEEAAARMELYGRTGRVTEELLAPAIRGVRLTQRATPGTLGFRAFSGGDQRIQVGQVAMAPDTRGRVRPILVTTFNAPDHDLLWVSPPVGAPATLRNVLWACPLPPDGERP